jgi:hypothetical protein
VTPALAINNGFITRESTDAGEEKYFLNLEVSNNTVDEGRILIVRSKALQLRNIDHALTLQLLTPNGIQCAPFISLEDLRTKAWALPCEVPRTAGPDFMAPGLFLAPYLFKCEIPKEEACPSDGSDEGIAVILAAGERWLIDQDEESRYHKPPLWGSHGTINGFGGVLSNLWEAKAIPGVCG